MCEVACGNPFVQELTGVVILHLADDAELVALGGDVNFILLETSHSHFDGVEVIRQLDDVVRRISLGTASVVRGVDFFKRVDEAFESNGVQQ